MHYSGIRQQNLCLFVFDTGLDQAETSRCWIVFVQAVHFLLIFFPATHEDGGDRLQKLSVLVLFSACLTCLNQEKAAKKFARA